MKLLQAIQRRHLLYSVLSLVLGGVLFYFTLKYFLDSQFTEQLHQEKSNFIEYYQHNSGRELSNNDRDILIQKAEQKFLAYETDTVIPNKLEEDEQEVFRMLVFPFQQNQQWYSVAIIKPLYESEDLALTISGVVLGILILQLLLQQILNRQFTKKLFNPFLETVNTMQQYKLDEQHELHLPVSQVVEFQKLNEAFLRLHERVHTDYEHLQQFTGNASHELQTPLAVLQSKMELLSQSDSLTEDQQILLHDMQATILRLSKLNQSLLLMAKIDNKFFVKHETVEINQLINERVEAVRDLIQFKEIELKIDFTDNIEVKMNAVLADVMISNLLNNALRHNTEKGFINISVHQRQLRISNSGNKPLESAKIFQRFYKGTNSSESSGLGLAMVKQICDQYNFIILYDWQFGTHIFTVEF